MMTTWEYCSMLNEGPAKKDALDALGAEGWEMVSVLQGAQTMQLLYVFKRPKAISATTVTETTTVEGKGAGVW